MKVGINKFVLRQTKESRFSHYDGDLSKVVELAEAYLAEGRRGYRDGVLEVDVPAAGFYSAVVKLEPGMKFEGVYESRREGEAPRRHVGVVGGQKMSAKGVTLILYRFDVLAIDGDNSTDAEWELISINARATEGPEPINPGVLMANHFGADGGTATNMTNAQFVEALKVSWEYWKDKAMLA